MFAKTSWLTRGLVVSLLTLFLLLCNLSQALAATAVVATIPLGTTPYGLGVNQATNRYYVTSVANNTVMVIDGSTNTLIATIPMAPGGNRPQAVVANPNTNRIYVTNFNSNTVAVIDGATNTVLTNIPGFNGPSGLEVNPNTNLVYVSQYNANSVAVIDGTTNTIISTYPVGAQPQQTFVNPVTNRVYTGNSGSGNITVYDANTNAISTLPFLGGLSANTAANKLYLSNGGTITVLDATTHLVINTINLGGNLWQVVANPNLNRLYAVSTSSNSVITLDDTTYAVLGSIPIGNTPTGGVFSPSVNHVAIINTGSSSVSIIGEINPPTITKAFGAASIFVNGTTSLSFTITNPNPTDILSGVAFTDNLPTGLVVATTPNVANTCGGAVTATAGSGVVSLAGGKLAANGNCTISLDVTGTSAGVKNNTTLPISATESGTGKASNTATLTVVTPTADVALQKMVDNRTPNVKDNVTFTLTITNNGPVTATNVVVTDALPTGLSYVSNSTPSQGNVLVNSGTVTWNVGTLANGTSATLQVIAQVTQSGAIINTITKTQTEVDPNSLNDQASVGLNAPTADLGVKKTVDNATPKVGDSVTFNVTLINNGPDPATGVVARDLLPAGLDYVSSVAPAGTTYNPTTGDWTVRSMSVGQSSTLQIVAKASQEGNFTNTATKIRQDQYDFNLTNDAASASLTVGAVATGGKSKPKVYPADFIVQLRVSPDRLASTDPTNLISYTLLVKNIGQGKADHVSIPFPIDPNLEVGYTTFSDPRMWVSEIIPGSDQPHVQLNLPPLEPTQWVSATLVFRPKTDAKPGAVLFTRYYVHWDDEEKAGKKAGSNAVRFSLSEDGTNRDDTGGAVQLFEPASTGLEPESSITISSDFYGPYELVNLWYTDKAGVSVSLGALNADPEGKLSFQFSAKGLNPGESYVVAGQGVRSEVTGSAVVTVSARTDGGGESGGM